MYERFEKTKLVVTILTLLGVSAYTGIQLWQTILIRGNNIVSQRDFVYIGHINGRLGFDRQSNTEIVVFIIPQINSGATATKNLRFGAFCKASDTEVAEPFIYFIDERRKTPQIKYDKDVIGPKATADTICMFTVPQISDMQNHKLYGYILGEILYEDRLDPTSAHKTQFSYELINVSLERPSGQFHLSYAITNRGVHNCADDECPANE